MKTVTFNVKHRDHGIIENIEGELIDHKFAFENLHLIAYDAPEVESTFFPLQHIKVREYKTGQLVASQRSLIESKEDVIARGIKEMETMIDEYGYQRFAEAYKGMDHINEEPIT